MPKHIKGPEKLIDINAGIRDLLAHAGVKSPADLLHGPAADCCIQACECCLQVSRTAQPGDLLSGEIKKIIGTEHNVG